MPLPTSPLEGGPEAMPHPTHALRVEHQVILKVLDCFEIALRRAVASQSLAEAEFRPFVEFFREFADRCHHCKEEDRLFPCLERCGLPREHGPIAVMLHEHQLGRAHVRAIAESLPAAAAGDPAALRRALHEGAEFIHLLREHIYKENEVLFQMADQMIGEADRAALAHEYESADGQRETRIALTQGRSIAAELCRRYGITPAPEEEGP